MSRVHDRSIEEPKPNYFVSDAGDGNPQIIRCSSPLGYPTVAAAKEAKIKEIQEEMRFHLTIGAKEQQSRMRLYCEINGLLNAIENAKKKEERVKKLELTG